MPEIGFQEIKQTVSEERKRLLKSHKRDRSGLNSVARQFRTSFRGETIKRVSDIFDLCHEVDKRNKDADNKTFEIPPEIQEVVEKGRKGVQKTLIDLFHQKERSGILRNDKRYSEKTQDITRRTNLAKMIAKIIPIIRAGIASGDAPEKITLAWIQLNCGGYYEQTRELIRHEEDTFYTYRWDEVMEMLPKDLRGKCDFRSKKLRKQEVVAEIKKYEGLIKQLGRDAVAQFLVATHKVEGYNAQQMVGIISEYIDVCSPRDVNLDDVASYPPALIKLTSVRELILIKLTKYVYGKLTEEGDDQPLAIYQGGLGAVRREMTEVLEEKFDKDTRQDHAELFEEVTAVFEKAFAIETPERMKDHLDSEDLDEEDTGHFFPSLRQRLAMVMYEEQKRGIIGLPAGKGKTAAAFLIKERQGLKKMLYLCPTEKLQRQTAARVGKYYKRGEEPTVGVIDKGMTKEELDQALDCEVVVMRFSLFSSEVDGVKIVDRLKNCDFDMIVPDELQNARKPGKRDTETLYELAQSIDGLYYDIYKAACESGAMPEDKVPANQREETEARFAGLSAGLAVNKVSDIVSQLRILDPVTYGSTRSLTSAIRATDPLVVRNPMLGYVLTLDDPERWEAHLNYIDVKPHAEEREIYRAILENDLLEPQQKLPLLLLALANPTLLNNGRPVESAVFDTVVKRVDHHFQTEDTVVVTENMLNEGIMTPHSRYKGETFYDKMKAHYGITTPNDVLQRAIDYSRFEYKYGETIDALRAGTPTEEALVGLDEREIGLCLEYGKIIESPAFAEFLEDNGVEDASLEASQGRLEALERLRGPLDIFVIDGTPPRNNEDYREWAVAQSRRIDRKTIIFAMTDTIKEGRDDLWHINAVVALEPNYNKANMYQLVKRFSRNTNPNAQVDVVRVIDSIHEGVYEHGEQKYDLITLWQHGGSFTDNDVAFLEGGNLYDEVRIQAGKIYIGTAILEKLLTDQQRLNRIFAYLNNRGEEKYAEFMEKLGEEFARLYAKTQETAYSGNNARFAAGVWREMESRGLVPGKKYLDAGCGTLVLDNSLGESDDDTEREIISLDFNKYMLDEGIKIKQSKNPEARPETREGSMSNMRDLFPDGHFDAVNCALAENYTRLNTRFKYVERDERVRSLLEQNRVLKQGGILMLTLAENRCTPKRFRAFSEQLEKHFGFEIIPEYSGVGMSTDNKGGDTFKNYTIVCRKIGEPNLKGLDLKKLKLGPETKPRAKGEARIPREKSSSERKGLMHTQFQIGESQVEFNVSTDALEEQERYSKIAAKVRESLEKLRAEHGELKDLPPEVQARFEEETGVKIMVYINRDGTTSDCFHIVEEDDDDEEKKDKPMIIFSAQSGEVVEPDAIES